MCVICGEEEGSAESKHTLPCGHTFHTTCIVRSLRYRPECPMCRDTDGVERQAPVMRLQFDRTMNVTHILRQLFQSRLISVPRRRLTQRQLQLVSMNRLSRRNSGIGQCRAHLWRHRKIERELSKQYNVLHRVLQRQCQRAPELLTIHRRIANCRRRIAYWERKWQTECHRSQG